LRVLVLAREEYRKGTDLLLSMFESLFKYGDDLNIEFIWIGEKAHNPSDFDTFEKFKIEYRDCIWLKKIKRIEKIDGLLKEFLLKTSDLLLIPSRSESFGIPIIEAMKFGLPVLHSDLDVMKELTTNVTEFIFPLNNPDSMAKKILHLYNNPELILKSRSIMKNRYTENFTKNKFHDNVLSIIEKMDNYRQLQSQNYDDFLIANDLVNIEKFTSWNEFNDFDFLVYKNDLDGVSTSLNKFDTLRERIKDYLNPGDVYLDLGCHIGTYLQDIALKLGNKGFVIGIDSQPVNCLVAAANLQLAGIYWFEMLNYVISDKIGRRSIKKIDLSSNANFGSQSIYDEYEVGEEINVNESTLDSIFWWMNKLSFVKFDIQSSEHEALLGGKKLIERTRPVIAFEVSKEWNLKIANIPAEETIKLIHGWNYDFEFDGKTVKLKTVMQLLSEHNQIDLIAVPN
jgi:FkbM family methyltransferase